MRHGSRGATTLSPVCSCTLFNEHFRVTGREKYYETIEEMQTDLDAYLVTYNTRRPHQGRAMKGRIPQKAFTDGLPKKENAKMKPISKAA
jgi:hypothetical protein